MNERELMMVMAMVVMMMMIASGHTIGTAAESSGRVTRDNLAN